MTLTEPDDPNASPVTVWNLEMPACPALGPSEPPVPGLALRQHDQSAADVSARFYRLVGADWHWVDRLTWTDGQWSDWVDRPELHLWTCWSGDDPVGYFELEQQSAGTVEVAYFGLVPGHQGRGIGRWLLERAIATAWGLPGTRRLWLHTCSLDGPNALANYRARGFQQFSQTIEYRVIQ